MESIALEEDLICAICRDVFVQPVTLPCGHNYCEGCVDQLRKSCAFDCERGRASRYSCPLCLAPCETRVRPERNALLHGIVEKWRGRRRAGGVDCAVCKGERPSPAAKSCVRCRESYCAVHVMPHLENGVFRRHVLVNPRADLSGLCRDHGKDVELYCRTDSTALCAFCMLPSENTHAAGHDVVRLTEAMDAVKEGCQVKLADVQGSLAEIRDNLQKLEEAAIISKGSLTNHQQVHTAFMKKIKLFLEVEEKAWQKRLSVDMVTESRKLQYRVEKMEQLQGRLQEAERTLQQAQSIQDPLTLIQLLEDVDWQVGQGRADLPLRELCSAKVQEVMEGASLQPAALARSIPLLHVLQETFPGEQIRLDPETAHPWLGMDADRTALWVTEGADGEREAGCDHHCALGAAPFSRGTHYWEVEVSGGASWALGVAYEGSPAQLLNGASCWSLAYSADTRQYCARHATQALCFGAERVPRAVGLFLDLHGGVLCFYDAELIQGLHTFCCHFRCPVLPLFSPGRRGDSPAAPTMRLLNPASPLQTP